MSAPLSGDASAGVTRWEYAEPGPFLERLRERLEAGVPPRRLHAITPIPVPEADELLRIRPSPVRFFTLAGALAGMASGFALTIFSVHDWPLITGGKPYVSIPPFIIIAWALTILLGALVSFLGFLLLSPLPSARRMMDPHEHGNAFVLWEEPAPARGSPPHAAENDPAGGKG